MGTLTGKLPDGTLVLKKPFTLPQILDVLIVGGGPAGTSAAFHAKELGLSTLVIDFDDILRRIRDYAKDKPIKPSYGGGDKMQFPKGGNLISSLHFSPIDKDEMHQSWKKMYHEFSIPTQIGVEMIGLSRRKDDIWEVHAKNHNTQKDIVYLTRHLIIAIGRGFPRRFDISGNLDGINYRLSDPQNFVGSPVCVVGGGTSAAEAVIAISHAKEQAEDKSSVYWSYRGEKMPRVSSALADEFFNTYIGNGNIRYLPKSEPAAIITAYDRQEYLSLRVDHRKIAERPNESLNLEFPKDKIIACIGEDLPEVFLKNIGIHMVTGGPKKKKRMVVSPILESQLPNVYMIGDLLSQAYLVTNDFAADPAGFQEARHLGIIKSALIDGVLVTEAIAKKLKGEEDFSVEIPLEKLPPKADAAARDKTKVFIGDMAEDNATQIGAVPNEEETSEAFLVQMLPDNVEGERYSLRSNGVTTIGRQRADIEFPEDTQLVENHASILHTAEGYFLRDDASKGRVYLIARAGKMIEAASGNVVRIGKQYLLFEQKGNRFVMIHFNYKGQQVKSYPLPEKTIVLGREAPDITLDASDKTLSRSHLSVTVKENKMFIRDLHSVNKTYLQVKNPVAIEDEDCFRLGNQVLKFTLSEVADYAGMQTVSNTILIPISKTSVRKIVQSPAEEEAATEKRKAVFTGEEVAEVKAAPEPPVEPAAPEAPAVPAAPAKGEMTITFKTAGKTCVFKKGDCILDIAKKNGIPINAECRLGSCGSDPILIVEGQENLNEIDDDEEITLENKDLEPGKYRMACVAKPTGPIVVEIVKE